MTETSTSVELASRNKPFSLVPKQGDKRRSGWFEEGLRERALKEMMEEKW